MFVFQKIWRALFSWNIPVLRLVFLPLLAKYNNKLCFCKKVRCNNEKKQHLNEDKGLCITSTCLELRERVCRRPLFRSCLKLRMCKSTNIWYQKKFTSFPSESHFDMVTALDLATWVNCLSVVLRKLFQVNGPL